jgi:hypothetical protein
MDHSGYKKLAVSNLEDRVRVGPQGVNNILTMAFAKK